jgi:hypothetical protein
MKKLTPIATPPNYIDLFESIRDSKNNPTKAVLSSAQAAIRNRFADYEVNFLANTLHSISASTLTNISSELRSCYNPTKGIRALKEAIKNAQPTGRLQWCPYCGATTPGSYDHYLPAAKFPEFSAHALNLVPSCPRCNSIKDNDWLHAGARQYLHFYLDVIPNVPFLTVTISSNPTAQAIGANFAVQRAGMTTRLWALVEAHFRKLKLIELYNSYSNDLINTALRSARSHINTGGSSAADFLAFEANENADLYGNFGWRAVLLRAMSSHTDLNLWIQWL